MLVKAVISFVSVIEGKTYRINEGQEGIELPDGADWLDAGFVVPDVGQKKETATKKPAETRAKTKRQQPTRTKKVDKVMSTKDIKK